MTARPTRDAGLQAERTALSWRRTALASAGVAALLLHQAAERGWGPAAIAPLFAMATLLVVAFICSRRGHNLHVGTRGVSAGAAVAISVAVTASALVSGVFELWYR